jgi:hypothetical protein
MSDAERMVLEELRRCLPSGWILLHSQWLKNHPAKFHAEVDFVLIGERAVLLLEVKGGRVWRDDAGWHFETKSGSKRETKAEGPFDQVRTAFYSVRDHLRDLGQISLFHDHVWGYGVVLPECVLLIPPGELAIEPDHLLDQRGFPERLGSFLESLTATWRQKCLQVKRNNGIPEATLRATIPPAVREQIRGCLRPLLRPVRGLGVTAREVETHLRRLTMEQYAALDQAAGNDRLVLCGAAGTGKTVLAVEQAVRQVDDARGRVLFTCFNRLLADHVRQRLREVPEARVIDVANYHQLVMRLVRDAEMAEEVPDDWDEFNRRVEDIVLAAAERLSARGRFCPYDYLVLDEGQDLMHPAFFASLGLLLKGGFKGGRWTVCIDPEQILYGRQYEQETHDLVLRLGAQARLTVNCRNTRQVAAYVRGLSGAGGLSVEGTDGPEVEIHYYNDLPSYRKLLKQSVNTLVGCQEEGKLPPGDMVVLTANKGLLPAEVSSPGFFVRPAVAIGTPGAENAIRISTVHSFKGLEASGVVLTGIDDLDNPASRRLLYIGGSRARAVLRLLLPQQSSDYVEANLHRVLAALAEKRATSKRAPLV